jgi:hypothetical protein
MTRTALALLATTGLALSACTTATAAPRTASVNPPHPGIVLVGSLDGKAEVPGPGDPKGNGEFTGFFDVPGGMLCYDLGIGSLDNVTMAHIHAGAPGTAGPVAIALAKPTGNHSEGCVPAPASVLSAIIANPGNYYVNVHTTAHPGGAIRAYLQRPNSRRARA